MLETLNSGETTDRGTRTTFTYRTDTDGGSNAYRYVSITIT